MTRITGHLVHADGIEAYGRCVISWPSFSIYGVSIAGGMMYLEITDGALACDLYPCGAAVPPGTYYTARFELDSGAVYEEYWIVPDSPNVTLEQIRVAFPVAPGLAVSPTQITGMGAQPGMILSWNGSNWVGGWVQVANVDPNYVRLEVGTAGTDFWIDGSPVMLGAGARFNLPDASPTARGVVTTGPQTFGGDKDFTGDVTIDGDLEGPTMDTIDARLDAIEAAAGKVTSVFGRTGIVVAKQDDYSVGMITGAAASARQIIAGTGLTGGGDLTANRTLAVVPGSTVQQLRFSKAGAFLAAEQELNLIQLGGVVLTLADDAANRRMNLTVDTTAVLGSGVPNTRSVFAGFGLTGGGQLSADITLSLNRAVAQTPWGQAIDGAGFPLNNAGPVTARTSVAINEDAADKDGYLYFRMAGNPRWRLGKDSGVEGPGDTGSFFVIQRYTDAGAIQPWLSVSRSNGTALVYSTDFIVRGNLHGDGDVSGGNLVVGAGKVLRFPDATEQTTAGVPVSRSILTPVGSGIQGGGNLTQDRTLSVVPDSVVQRIKFSKAGVFLASRPEVNFIEGSNITINTVNNTVSNRMDVTITAVPIGGASPSNYRVNGALVGTRPTLNLIQGAGTNISGLDQAAFDRVDVTITATAGGGAAQTPWTSDIDGAGFALLNAGQLNANGKVPSLLYSDAAIVVRSVNKTAVVEPFPDSLVNAPRIGFQWGDATGQLLMFDEGAFALMSGAAWVAPDIWEQALGTLFLSDLNAADIEGVSCELEDSLDIGGSAWVGGQLGVGQGNQSGPETWLAPVMIEASMSDTTGNLAYSPRIGFHWTTDAQIGIDSVGTVRTFNWDGSTYAPFAAALLESKSGGVKFPDGTIQVTAATGGGGGASTPDTGLIIIPSVPTAGDLPAEGAPNQGCIVSSTSDLWLWGTPETAKFVAADMAGLHEGNPHGVPTDFGWYTAPFVEMGNDPEGSKALNHWFNVYTDTSGALPANTRVNLRRSQVWWKRLSTGEWTMGVNDDSPEVESYDEDYGGGPYALDQRTEPDGSISVKPAAGKNAHGFTPFPRVAIDPNDMGGIVSLIEARLILDNAGGTDDRGASKYMVEAGADYYPDVTGPGIANNPGVGGGKFRYVKNDWNVFSFTTLSEAELRSNPPPLDLSVSGSWINASGVPGSGGSGQAQTPWAQDVDAAGHLLLNAPNVLLSDVASMGRWIALTDWGDPDVWAAPIQIRETSFVQDTNLAASNSPRIGFNWAGVAASQIGMDSTGWVRTFSGNGAAYAPFVAQEIKSSSVGFRFPDNTLQTTAATGSGGGHAIQDEGAARTQRAALNFVGAGVTVTDDAANNRTVVTIPGGGAGAQTPWTQNVDANLFSLSQASSLGMRANRTFAASDPAKAMLWAHGGSPGVHDYGAIILRPNPNTGDGGAAYFDMYVGGGSSVATANQRFLRAINPGGGTPAVSSIELGASVLLTGTSWPQFAIQHGTTAAKARMMMAVAGSRFDFTTNLNFDGTNWMRDDVAQDSGLYSQINGQHSFYSTPAGTNPATAATKPMVIFTRSIPCEVIATTNGSDCLRVSDTSRSKFFIVKPEVTTNTVGLAYWIGAYGTIKFEGSPVTMDSNLTVTGNVAIGTTSQEGRLTIDGGDLFIRDGHYAIWRPPGNGWDMRIRSTGNQLDIVSGGAPTTAIASFVHGGAVTIPGPLSVNGVATMNNTINVNADLVVNSGNAYQSLSTTNGPNATRGIGIHHNGTGNVAEFYTTNHGATGYAMAFRIEVNGTVWCGGQLNVSGSIDAGNGNVKGATFNSYAIQADNTAPAGNQLMKCGSNGWVYLPYTQMVISPDLGGAGITRIWATNDSAMRTCSLRDFANQLYATPSLGGMDIYTSGTAGFVAGRSTRGVNEYGALYWVDSPDRALWLYHSGYPGGFAIKICAQGMFFLGIDAVQGQAGTGKIYKAGNQLCIS